MKNKLIIILTALLMAVPTFASRGNKISDSEIKNMIEGFYPEIREKTYYVLQKFASLAAYTQEVDSQLIYKTFIEEVNEGLRIKTCMEVVYPTIKDLLPENAFFKNEEGTWFDTGMKSCYGSKFFAYVSSDGFQDNEVLNIPSRTVNPQNGEEGCFCILAGRAIEPRYREVHCEWNPIICQYAFSDMPFLEKVTFGGDTAKLEARQFINCPNLELPQALPHEGYRKEPYAYINTYYKTFSGSPKCLTEAAHQMVANQEMPYEELNNYAQECYSSSNYNEDDDKYPYCTAILKELAKVGYEDANKLLRYSYIDNYCKWYEDSTTPEELTRSANKLVASRQVPNDELYEYAKGWYMSTQDGAAQPRYPWCTAILKALSNGGRQDATELLCYFHAMDQGTSNISNAEYYKLANKLTVARGREEFLGIAYLMGWGVPANRTKGIQLLVAAKKRGIDHHIPMFIKR